MIEITAQSMEERARAAGCPILDFDIEDGQGFTENVYGMFDLALEKGPFFYSTAARGFWVFSDMKMITEAHLRPDIFSNDAVEVFLRGEAPMPTKMIPEQLDPPEHMKYRGALMSLFTPGYVKRYEEEFRKLCIEYIDRIAGHDSCDFMVELGRPLPADFFLGLMGVPQEARIGLTDALIRATFTTNSEDPTGEIRKTNAAIVVEHVRDLVALRRDERGDDLFSSIMDRPSGIGHARTPPLYLKDGDTVECTVENICMLRNNVLNEQRA